MYAIAFDMRIAELVDQSIEWFRNSVRDIRAFKVEDWSDFTESVKYPEIIRKKRGGER